jgi:uncharacterized peroxidase-related enzyme
MTKEFPMPAALEPMYLRDVENNPQQSPYLGLIESARQEGRETWQIWNLFAFRPEITIHMGRFTHALMHESGPISNGLRELIAAYVSSLNECGFCLASHRAVSSHLLGEDVVTAVLHDVDTSPITQEEKALLHFVRKVTFESSSITLADVEAQHRAGWSDEALYYAVSIAALFNFYNRWISGTGVHAVSAEGHKHHASVIATKGYTRG